MQLMAERAAAKAAAEGPPAAPSASKPSRGTAAVIDLSDALQPHPSAQPASGLKSAAGKPGVKHELKSQASQSHRQQQQQQQQRPAPAPRPSSRSELLGIRLPGGKHLRDEVRP